MRPNLEKLKSNKTTLFLSIILCVGLLLGSLVFAACARSCETDEGVRFNAHIVVGWFSRDVNAKDGPIKIENIDELEHTIASFPAFSAIMRTHQLESYDEEFFKANYLLFFSLTWEVKLSQLNLEKIGRNGDVFVEYTLSSIIRGDSEVGNFIVELPKTFNPPRFNIVASHVPIESPVDFSFHAVIWPFVFETDIVVIKNAKQVLDLALNPIKETAKNFLDRGIQSQYYLYMEFYDFLITNFDDEFFKTNYFVILRTYALMREITKVSLCGKIHINYTHVRIIPASFISTTIVVLPNSLVVESFSLVRAV
ncbi:MAG: hypothetical protein FWD86_02695 [Firmicutes bacterium]|nr:hypothetical protein [Bacillota bacterium]